MEKFYDARVVFHASMLIVDLLALFLLLRLARKSSWPLLGLVLYPAVAVLVAIAAGRLFHLNWIGCLRLAAEAIFWHLPVLLVLISFRGSAPARLLLRVQAVVLLVVYVDAYHIEPRWLEVNQYTFSPPRLKGLERPIRIAEMSDIQTERVGSYERKVFARLTALKPDLVFYTGDYVDAPTAEGNMMLARQLRAVIVQSGLKPALGSYTVRGDSDSFEIIDVLFGGIAKLIDNEVLPLQLPGVKANLIGVSAGWSRMQYAEGVRRVLRTRTPGLFDICIAHSPEFAKAMTETGDPFLLFAGHTHGGQVQLPFIGPLYADIRMPRRYADYYGFYGAGILTVSRGIGMERGYSPRVRFFCRPEIRIIELVPPPL